MRLERLKGGLGYITNAEIKAANRRVQEPNTERENTSYWPNHRTNLSLKAQLCEGYDCSVCDVQCGFGREYLKRVAEGRMQPIDRRTVAS